MKVYNLFKINNQVTKFTKFTTAKNFTIIGENKMCDPYLDRNF